MSGAGIATRGSQSRLAAKQAEVNQVANIIGKPLVEENRRLSAQLVTSYAQESGQSGGSWPDPPAVSQPVSAQPLIASAAVVYLC